MRYLSIVLVLFALIATPTLAVEPDEMLSDPVLEARAREISKELRCVVCQNQDIDSSNAGVARDLRLLVRERLVAGDANDEVLAFIQARYGDYVLLKPPFKPSTYVLWFAPLFLIFLVFVLGWRVLAVSNRPRSSHALTREEEAYADQVIKNYQKGDRE
ncbi:cytochrome c-type biogenesis protein CcmH [Pseudovibrio denitrificans]|uniref:Cytochrome c-type biogenesis protein n=1 Tax=Pseudovibrio denitrificans TaxID=258256 RepID=A0A1I6YKX2_9HYPH|nr:cytochrome c-type biogenesis protein [Pseudovibrio denitrificans]SFT51095.1 cytochrome c-type biogenesis protein CcmH [Pseudovibrio denitrificans]